MSAGKTWQGAVEKSNKKEQARVSRKYKGVKKVSADMKHFDADADPFQEDDPVVDKMSPGRTHKLDQYARAAGLPQAKAKKILEQTDTLQK